VIAGLVEAGMSVARLNFAHGDPDQHRETVRRIRAASERCQRPIAILQDLPGPKLRLGELDAPARLDVGAAVVLDCKATRGAGLVLPVLDPYLPAEVVAGGTILLGDGAVELEVTKVNDTEIHCLVTVGGEVSTGKGVNASGRVSSRPILSEKDFAALALGVELGVDFVGVSYVRTEDDLVTVRRELRRIGRPCPLVAKIETAVALEHLPAILDLTEAVMVARGDLSLEIPYERVPAAQKRIVQEARCAGRPVITATQMLQSMVTASRPTRAEATDVANAVLDGTDAVMLSDETAVGVDPVRACRAMARIIEDIEASVPPMPLDIPMPRDELRELCVFARAAVATARDVGARAIVTWSKGGLAARLLSQQRPTVPVITPTRSLESYRRLALPYGVFPLHVPSGRIELAQLEARIGPLDPQSLLLLMRHQAGDGRRIPHMALARVADTNEWAIDTRDP
jgi:pyruvate kinase